MTQSPTVSVIMPAYNAGGWIKEAIQSVLDQSYSDWELVIIDDGSADDTTQAVKSFSDPRIQLYSQKNQGVSAARNAGIGKSTGGWLAFLDTDDIWLKDKLKTQSAYFENFDFIFGPAIYMGGPYDGRSTADFKSRIPDDYPEMITKLVEGNFIDLSGVCLRKSLDTNWFNTKLKFAEDYELWLRIFSQPIRSKYVAEPFVKYRVHPASASQIIGDQELLLAKILASFSDNQTDPLHKSAMDTANRYYSAYISQRINQALRSSRKEVIISESPFQLNPKISLKLFLYRHLGIILKAVYGKN
jgi:glycosyltransferase involved in cell wall biosynthesis